MSSLSTSLKNSYQKWLHPYEEYLRIAKPGVQQQLEFEYGGPFTPSSADSPLRRAHQETPPRLRDDSPAIRASATLNATLKESEEPSDPPPPASGFTAVNSGGFTPVNLAPASSFQAVNQPNSFLKREVENGTPGSVNRSSNEGLMPVGRDTPEFRNTNLGMPHTNGHDQNPLKRTISHDSMNIISSTDSTGAEYEDQNGRRSKRIKKGECSDSYFHNWLRFCSSHSNCSRPHEYRYVLVLTSYGFSAANCCRLTHEPSPSCDPKSIRRAREQKNRRGMCISCFLNWFRIYQLTSKPAVRSLRKE